MFWSISFSADFLIGYFYWFWIVGTSRLRTLASSYQPRPDSWRRFIPVAALVQSWASATPPDRIMNRIAKGGYSRLTPVRVIGIWGHEWKREMKKGFIPLNGSVINFLLCGKRCILQKLRQVSPMEIPHWLARRQRFQTKATGNSVPEKSFSVQKHVITGILSKNPWYLLLQYTWQKISWSANF